MHIFFVENANLESDAFKSFMQHGLLNNRFSPLLLMATVTPVGDSIVHVM